MFQKEILLNDYHPARASLVVTFDASPAHNFRIPHERLILNQSGAPVAVEKAGIGAFYNVSPSAQPFQLARDLVSISVHDASGIRGL